MTAGRGVADHHASTRLRPPLVCCIRLFYSAVRIPTTSSSAVLGQGQIVRLIHAAALANATREGVARRALLSLPNRQGCDAPKHGGRPPAARSGAMAPHLEHELRKGRPRDQAYEVHLLTKVPRPT
jgi:hypothetical protein